MTNAGHTVEITVKQSTKIVIIAKYLAKVEGGYLFHDEIKNERFALSDRDVLKLEKI